MMYHTCTKRTGNVQTLFKASNQKDKLFKRLTSVIVYPPYDSAPQKSPSRNDKFERFVYILTHDCLKVHKLIKLGQMANLNVIFHVMVSIYRLVKI